MLIFLFIILHSFIQVSNWFYALCTSKLSFCYYHPSSWLLALPYKNWCSALLHPLPLTTRISHLWTLPAPSSPLILAVWVHCLTFFVTYSKHHLCVTWFSVYLFSFYSSNGSVCYLVFLSNPLSFFVLRLNLKIYLYINVGRHHHQL